MYSLPMDARSGSARYELEFFETADGLEEDVLKARLAKEAASLPRFTEGGAWRRDSGANMREAHLWLMREHGAYKASRAWEHSTPDAEDPLWSSY